MRQNEDIHNGGSSSLTPAVSGGLVLDQQLQFQPEQGNVLSGAGMSIVNDLNLIQGLTGGHDRKKGLRSKDLLIPKNGKLL